MVENGHDIVGKVLGCAFFDKFKTVPGVNGNESRRTFGYGKSSCVRRLQTGIRVVQFATHIETRDVEIVFKLAKVGTFISWTPN